METIHLKTRNTKFNLNYESMNYAIFKLNLIKSAIS